MSNAGRAAGRAVPFIELAGDKFIVTDEGRQFLSSVQGPISTVAVVGKYRTGKSFLMNRILLDRGDGFTVGPTVNGKAAAAFAFAFAVVAVVSAAAAAAAAMALLMTMITTTHAV